MLLDCVPDEVCGALDAAQLQGYSCRDAGGKQDARCKVLYVFQERSRLNLHDQARAGNRENDCHHRHEYFVFLRSERHSKVSDAV